MTHEDAGKYAAKHPPGTKPDEQIAEAVRRRSSGGGLACAVGEKISKELGVEIAAVGLTVDLLELKIKNCQLGLFGWGDKPNHGKDIQAVASVSAEMRTALKEAAEGGQIVCAAVWEVADRLKAKRKEVSGACEALNIKIRKCQLGAF